MSFSFSDLHQDLQRGIADLGFTEPTPIQRDAIPPALEGRDLLACAMTGSGKTAAFLLPVMHRLLEMPRGTTRVLVLSPTRELAAQIVDHFNELARYTKLKAAAVYGGVGMGPQERAFRRGVDVIVACPGRLLDHFQRGHADLDDLAVLVLDEADRMLDMGFLPDIKRVLKHIPQPQQSLLFSATMPQQIVKLSKQILRDPLRINVERKSAPAKRIEQSVFPVPQNLKAKLLAELIHRGEIGNALVFTRTKHRANRLVQFLSKQNVSCDRIHGNRSQAQRTRALADFKKGKSRILVATDIAARGIDVEELSHVVNFDVPNVAEDYIHRVGRTARAQASGEAFTFVAPQEQRDFRDIERAVGKQIPRRQLEGFDADSGGEALEIPLHERLAAHRSKRSQDRARSRAKQERSHQGQGGDSQGSGGRRRRSRKGRPGQGATGASGRPSSHAPRSQGQGGGRKPAQAQQSAGGQGQSSPESRGGGGGRRRRRGNGRSLRR